MKNGRGYGAVVVVAALIAAAVGTPARAQQGIAMEARAGVAIPTGDLADTQEAGLTAGLGLGFDVGGRVAVTGDVELGTFGEGLDDVEPGSSVAADLSLWHVTGGIEFRLLDPTMTYWALSIHGGAGITAFDPDPGEGHTYPTGRAGLKLGYRFSPDASFVFDVRTNVLFVDEADFQDTGFDVESGTIWTLPVTAGLRLSF